jgi:hypothetical protein
VLGPHPAVFPAGRGRSPDQLGDWADAWTERIAVLYRAHHALAATTPGTDARQDAAGRWQRAFTDIDAHRILQARDAGKGLQLASAPVPDRAQNERSVAPACAAARRCSLAEGLRSATAMASSPAAGIPGWAAGRV